MHFQEFCRPWAARVDAALDELLPPETTPPATIFRAMRYSVFAGGKRLRPLLLLATAQALGAEAQRFLPLACGLELIHTYSLIHDDLPAMDNDDYRRGRLTNHKVFGEAVAILAGDALLTQAFAVMLAQPDVEPALLLRVTQEVAHAAGPLGLVGGQVVDLEAEHRRIDGDTLRFMHRAKTGAMFRAAVRAGALLAGARERELAALTEYAEQFGLAFQITDDILDVTGDAAVLGKPVGSDEKNDKSTYVSLYSLPEAQRMARETVAKAVACLRDFGPSADVLRELAAHLVERKK